MIPPAMMRVSRRVRGNGYARYEAAMSVTAGAPGDHPECKEPTSHSGRGETEALLREGVHSSGLWSPRRKGAECEGEGIACQRE